MKKKTTRKNPMATVDTERSRSVAEPQAMYGESRKEYLLKKFENNTWTLEEEREFLKIPNAELTIEQIARTQRIDPDIYKQLLQLDESDGRYVYYNMDDNEYEQSDELLSENEISIRDRIIDLQAENGLVVRSFGGLL